MLSSHPPSQQFTSPSPSAPPVTHCLAQPTACVRPVRAYLQSTNPQLQPAYKEGPPAPPCFCTSSPSPTLFTFSTAWPRRVFQASSFLIAPRYRHIDTRIPPCCSLRVKLPSQALHTGNPSMTRFHLALRTAYKTQSRRKRSFSPIIAVNSGPFSQAAK
ncbi:hypothetical protein DPSP01_006989 [Paraphaeosphaeria sporulosa]